MDAEEEEVLVAACATIIIAGTLIKKKRRKKRSICVKSWLAQRDAKGAYNNIIQELKLGDKDNYRRYLRMNSDTFEELISLVSPGLKKDVLDCVSHFQWKKKSFAPYDFWKLASHIPAYSTNFAFLKDPFLCLYQKCVQPYFLL